MTESADIVIAGAGIIGLSSALHLARRTRGRIVVLEKGVGFGEGSTGASSAVCRARYTRDEMVRLARYGIAAYRDWGAFVGLSDPVARYVETGVLWLGYADRAGTEGEADRLSSLGVAAACIDDAALVARYPAINPCPIAPDLIGGAPHECASGGSHLIEAEGGYVEPMDALQDLLAAARRHGVDVRFDVRVTGVSMNGDTVSGVETNAGAIGCGALLNAAGPWCQAINDMVGLPSPWPLRATRIQIAQVDLPPGIPGPIPTCADPAGGIYFRPQNGGRQIVVGSVQEEDEREEVRDPDDFDRGVDDMFVATKLHALQHRIRGLEQLRGVRGYSGLYTMNRSDVHPVIGATPIGGYYVANGFSGHGFKLAPAIGSLVAQSITAARQEGDCDIGLDFLAYARQPIEVASRSVLA